MLDTTRPSGDDVNQLLVNAQLRDALEPYYDESVEVVDSRCMPTSQENEFLASMLAWECAPILPLCRWFEPELKLPPPSTLSDERLQEILWQTIGQLYERGIVLEFTDHLSDRELYCLICRDILPSPTKKLDLPGNYLIWRCLDVYDDCDAWLKYYATERERQMWSAETGQTPPRPETPPYPRQLPGL